MPSSPATPARFKTERDFLKNYPNDFSDREKRLAQAVLENKNLTDTFRQALVVSNFDDADGTIYTGAAAEVLAFNSGRAVYEQYLAAVATPAVLAPFQSADGLEMRTIGVADALELTNGTTALSPSAFTAGTDSAFFCEITFKVDTIANVTEAFYGFRKAEAYQVDPDSYAAVAAFHIGATDNGRISLTTSVSSTETVTDTTLADWADGASHTLRIEVDGEGACKFLYDGAVPTVTKQFSFTAGEVVVPFFHLNAETADPGVSISSWKCGRL